MKPLTLEETRLKEEMKHNCFWDNIHYKNPEAEKAFNLICHLEDFEVQYWELQKENKQLKEKLDKYENPEDMTLMMMWCDEKLKDKNKRLQERIELLTHYKTLYQSLKKEKEEFRKYLKKMLDDENDIFSVVRVKDVLSKLEESEGD